MRLKHFLSVFLTLLTLSVGQMWGATASFAPSNFSGQGTSGTGSTISSTVDGVTFSCDKGFGTTQFRCYQNGTITISSSNTITAISFTFSGSYTGGMQTTYTNLSTTSWTQKLSSQARITACTVTYTPSAASHALSSAVSPTASGSVSLSSTSVTEGSTATATATPAAHYVFTSWSISGTGASLSSTTTNPTTVTMGTANATVTANFTQAPKASITLSEAGATTTDATTYYVGDQYTLPSSTEATCSGKVLVGWSTVEVAETNTKPSSNFYEKGETVTLVASQTFYAVFAKAGGSASTEYVLTAASAVNAGTYIIAAYDATNSKYVTLTGATSGSTNVDLANETTGVTLTNSKFTTAPTGACEFTLAGNASDGFTIKNADANGYLGYTVQGTSRRLAFGNDYSTYTWKVGELEYDNYTTGCYIHRDLSSNYTISANGSSTPFIRGYSGSTKYKPIYFFKKTSNVTYTKYATTCCSSLGQINGSFFWTTHFYPVWPEKHRLKGYYTNLGITSVLYRIPHHLIYTTYISRDFE